MRLAASVLSLLFLLACSLGDAGDREIRATGERLVQELPQQFPGRIDKIYYEQNYLDPPRLSIETPPTMGREEAIRFMCDDILPLVEHPEIALRVNGGYAHEHC